MDPTYDELLARGKALYPGTRIGRPGRSRRYFPMITGLRLLRITHDVHVEGAEQVGDGPAILIGNHSSGMDPVVVVMTQWWRIAAFTKLEAFESVGGIFFRVMGQIPLRRGDPEATAWAMEMSRALLADGGKVALYPEGTRGPDENALYRLHKRILVPLLQANPDIPVHVVVTRYTRRPRRRVQATVLVSGPLSLDPRTMDADELTAAIRDALVELGGLTYVDRYARDVKAELRAQRQAGEGSSRHT